MRVGLLGGSFNPAHAGHRHVAAAGAAAAAAGSGVAAGLAGQSAEAARRHGAVRAAAGLGARASPTGGASWPPRSRRRSAPASPSTRCACCCGDFPRVRFVWLMGADILAQLPRWRRWREIAAPHSVRGAAASGLYIVARWPGRRRGGLRMRAGRHARRVLLPWRAPGLGVPDARRSTPPPPRAIRASAKGAVP